MPDLRPQLAFDAKGAALAIWSYFEPHPRFVEDGYAVDYTFGLRAAGRAPGGRFDGAQTLTDRLDADPSADVAIDPPAPPSSSGPTRPACTRPRARRASALRRTPRSSARRRPTRR